MRHSQSCQMFPRHRVHEALLKTIVAIRHRCRGLWFRARVCVFNEVGVGRGTKRISSATTSWSPIRGTVKFATRSRSLTQICRLLHSLTRGWWRRGGAAAPASWPNPPPPAPLRPASIPSGGTLAEFGAPRKQNYEEWKQIQGRSEEVRGVTERGDPDSSRAHQPWGTATPAPTAAN